MKKLKLFGILLCVPLLNFAQETTWDLQKCVDYALENNISVKQSDVQARLDELTLKQSKAMRVPTLNFNTQGGYNFGRSINPTTNQFTTKKILSQNYSLQSGITLFNFFKIKNDIKSSEALAAASKSDIDRAKSDVALNVAAAYLQYLLSLEQVNIAQGQIKLTVNQLDLTKKQVAAGSVPELNSAQLESQLATDSSTYITNIATKDQNKLQLLALLNLSADAPFEVSLPDVDKIPLEPLDELDPKALYNHALGTQYQQKVDSLKIASAKYASKSARAAMYPTISSFGSVGSNYSNFRNTGLDPATGLPYFVPPVPYGKQVFNINLTQAIGLSLNVPLFNNRQSRTAWEKAKINIQNLNLQKEQDDQKLQQDIYTAYNNARTGIEKYNANTKGESYAAYANHLAQLRYDNGMLSASDYLVSQNNLYTAKINRSSAHYEYIFRLKVLEYYKYNQIRL